MASLTPENLACIQDFDNFEFSQIDGALLMSFLDDTQALEDCDDERLTSVMKSLEAEIDLNLAQDKNSFQDSTWAGSNLSDHEYKEGQKSSCSTMLDFNWMDMEMETEEVVASLPSDLMASWYMDATTEHEAIIQHHEFGNIDQRDYFQMSNYGISLDDHEHGSLRQETNHASMVHG